VLPYFIKMALICSIGGEWRKLLEGKELNCKGLLARPGAPPDDVTEKDNLESVVELQRSTSAIGIKYADDLPWHRFIAAFLPNLS
jgi:hypothetical protein